jgi:glycosyltransferase involved in cell wall biosynthesis/SAM-dependent methyltransferase
MNVLLVSPEPFLEVRGTPLNVYQMCRALLEAGHEVHLATYPIGDDVRLPGLALHRSPRLPGISRIPIGFSFRKVMLDALLAPQVWLLMARQRFDVVHAVEEAVFFCLPAARLTRTPLIYDLDSHISDQLGYTGAIGNRRILAGIRALERHALGRARCVITVCRSLSEFVRSESPGATIFQIEDCPLEESLRDPDPERVQRLRRELDLEGRRVVLYTGNLEAYQGLDLLLEAMARLAEDRPDAVALLVGGEPDQVEVVRARARALRPEPRVVLAGKQPPTTMPEYMALAEVLVSPRREGRNTPLKIFTYMASGKPIVATDLETHTQVLDPRTAVLVPPTAEGLAAGILRVLQDPPLARSLARAARERVERDYSYAAFRRKIEEVYRFAARGAAGHAGRTPPHPNGPPPGRAVPDEDDPRIGTAAPDWRLEIFRKSVLKQAKLREALRMLGPTSGKECLDLGSGNGTISLLLRRTGGRWRSGDLGEGAVESIRDLVGSQVVRVDGAALPFEDGSLDLVLVLDMLEHVRTDRELLAEVARVLRTSGAVVLHVPHARRFAPLRRLRDGLGLTDAWHGHLRPGYTLAELRALLPPELRVAAVRSYARFFSELLDTALNAAYARKRQSAVGAGAAAGAGAPTPAEGEGGTVTETDFERNRKAFRLLSWTYPALWLFSKLDLLIPFSPGSLLLVRAEKILPGPPVPPVDAPRSGGPRR